VQLVRNRAFSLRVTNVTSMEIFARFVIVFFSNSRKIVSYNNSSGVVEIVVRLYNAFPLSQIG